jgi:pyrroloquinoline quinone biosynthesis protein D
MRNDSDANRSTIPDGDGFSGNRSPAQKTTGAAMNGTVLSSSHPRLAAHVRLKFDQARQRHVLLAPEAVSVLNATGAAILGLCDGERTVAEIVAELRGRYERVVDDEVRLFLARLAARRCLELGDG